MRWTVLGTVVLMAAAGWALGAQGGPETSGGEQTIMGCVKGDGSEKNPWMLAGVVIPPPVVVPPPGPPGGGRGRGGPGGPGAPGGAPGAGRGGPPPAPATPPPPPPPPRDFKLSGINMTPWMGMRAQVTGTGTTADFKVSEVRSMWGTCQ